MADRESRGRSWGCLLVLIAIAGGAVAWNSGALGSIVPAAAPARCTVGLNGAAVSVSVDGPGALAQCQSFLGQVTDGGTWYLYPSAQQAAGTIVCQVTYARVTFDVRDQGALDVYGNTICQRLFALANGQASP